MKTFTIITTALGDAAERYDALEARILAFMASSDANDDDAFNDLALAIFEFQFANNAPFAAFCRQQREGRRLEHWSQIPAVPTEAFKLPDYPLRSFPENEVMATFLTSGTTGETRGRHDFRSLRLYEESVQRGWELLGLPLLPMLVVMLSPEEAQNSSLTHMMNVLGGRYFMDGQSGIDRNALTKVAKDIPVILVGTALSLLHLADDGEPLPLCDGSWLFETGGYKGTDISWSKEDLYARFERGFHVRPERMINEYSMTELSSQFYTTGLHHAHRGPAWVKARVIDPESGSEVTAGKRGVLEICDLANLGSVIAIRTQDMATRTDDGSAFFLHGRDPRALPRGCSRAADEMLTESQS